MSSVDLKGLASAAVRTLDPAQSEPKARFSAEDWSSVQVQEFVEQIVAAAESSRVKLRSICAGRLVFQKLGMNSIANHGSWKGIPVAAIESDDDIEFVFLPRK